MHSISLDMETLAASSFPAAPRLHRDSSSLSSVRSRRPWGLRILLLSAGAVMLASCATLSAPSGADAPTRADVDAANAAVQAAEDAMREAQTDAAQARAEAAAAQQDAAQARAEADSAGQDAAQARVVADAARRDADQAMAKVDEMMMAAYQPSAVSVPVDMLNLSLLSLDGAQASLAGPDSIYISSIRYGGETYSALLKYAGGTSATVAGVFGRDGKLIPDSVGLGLTELAFLAPNRLVISNVEVGGRGYSGELQYAGGNRLQVAGIRRVTLPPTPAERIAALQAELAAAEAATDQAMADVEAAMAAAEAAQAAAGASAADAAAAQARLDAIMADAFQPSQVMVSAEMLDPSRANIDQVQVSLAGPDRIYLSNIRYDGVPYSALLRYSGGTTATVEAVYGPMGKLIPDSVGLAQTELDFRAPASLAVSNVEVGGVGYSGTLEYAGGNRLQVTNIRQVTLPPTAAEAAAAAIAEAEAAAAAAVSAAQADAGAARAEADAALAAAETSAAEAAAAQARLEAMIADAYQPSQVMVSAAMLDPSRANIDQVQVSLAGPDRIYLSNIRYDGVPYSALLRYSGGTSATVEAVYGPMGKLIPDSVGLAQTELDFRAPAALAVSNVEVGGVGYSGTLEYVGGDRLQVTNIRRVTLPPTAAEMAQTEIESLNATIAALEAALADAEMMANETDEELAEARAEIDAMMAAAYQPSEVMITAEMLDPSRANIDQVRISLAGPDAIYLANIRYDGVPYSALLKYSGGTSATVEAVYGPTGKLIPDAIGLSQTTLEFVAPAALAVSNVEVGGVGYSGTLEYVGGNQLRVSNLRRVTLPPTAAEMAEAAAAAAIARAEADADATMSAARAEADAAMSAADRAQAAADSAMADARTARAATAAANEKIAELEAQIARLVDGIPLSGINADLVDLGAARLTVAGPNSVYISGLQYGGREVSARVRYEAGTGKVEALYGAAADHLIAEAVSMETAELELVGNALRVSNVGVHGMAHTLTLTLNAAGSIDVAAQNNGWAVRTAAEVRRDKLVTEGTYLVNGFAGGRALAGEGAWSESGATVTQTDAGASHAKYTIPASQAGSEMLFGVTASAPEAGDKVGFGLHLLASDTPESGNTWNYGRSYLIWATRDPFYDTDATHLQFYESRDNNTLTWLASRKIEQSLTSPLTLEALYQSNGVITLLVGGEEQISLNTGTAITAGDHIALRSLGGPVRFTQVFVTAR